MNDCRWAGGMCVCRYYMRGEWMWMRRAAGAFNGLPVMGSESGRYSNREHRKRAHAANRSVPTVRLWPEARHTLAWGE
ncbi:MAG: hypothetical protein R6U98_07450, partial [Pirellulaceae bacterium]